MSDELAETDVVTVFLRHDADVLLLCRSEAVGSYSGRWSGVAGHVEEGDRTESGHPDGAVRRETREETGMVESDVTLVDRGDRFSVEDRDLGTRWVVRPYLFDAATRAVEPNYETADWEWVPPTEILRRDGRGRPRTRVRLALRSRTRDAHDRCRLRRGTRGRRGVAPRGGRGFPGRAGPEQGRHARGGDRRGPRGSRLFRRRRERTRWEE